MYRRRRQVRTWGEGGLGAIRAVLSAHFERDSLTNQLRLNYKNKAENGDFFKFIMAAENPSRRKIKNKTKN